MEGYVRGRRNAEAALTGTVGSWGSVVLGAHVEYA